MHVSGVARVAAAYEHIDPRWSAMNGCWSLVSGRSNIMALAEKYHIRNDTKLMDKILAKVVSKENAGYQPECRGLV